jgi:hypothetical protein
MIITLYLLISVGVLMLQDPYDVHVSATVACLCSHKETRAVCTAVALKVLEHTHTSLNCIKALYTCTVPWLHLFAERVLH